MKAKEFIKSSISNIVSSFSNLSCSYQYDSICDTHYIKILPEYFFKNSTELSTVQAEIIDVFYENYPDQSVVFLTTGSLIELNNIEYTINGSKCDEVALCPWSGFESKEEVELDNKFYEIELLLAGPSNYALAA